MDAIRLKNIVKIKKIWAAFFLTKVFYLFIAKLIFSKFTTLGDTFRYLDGPKAWESGWYYTPSVLMDSFAGTSASILGLYLGSLPFVIISFFGIYYPLSKLNIEKRKLVGLLFILSLPSFGIWTSIASKESVSVFFLGVILRGYFNVYRCEKIENRFLFFFACYLCLVFKPQYMIAVFAIFSYTYLARKLFTESGLKGLLFVIAVFVGCTLLYVFRDVIDGLSAIIPLHFSQESDSTRVNDIWVDQYDVFTNAPYGMYIAFVGPTLGEAASKFTHLFALIESFIVLSVFFLFMTRYFCFSAVRGKINVMFIAVFLLASFWILFVHYPFGALNPGSAIRYREAFFSFLTILFYFLYREAMSGVVIKRKMLTF